MKLLSPAWFSKPIEFHGFKIWIVEMFLYFREILCYLRFLTLVPYNRFGLNKDFRTEQSNKIQETSMSTFTAVLHKEDDMYVAECPGSGNSKPGDVPLKKQSVTLRKQLNFTLKNFFKRKRKGRS